MKKPFLFVILVCCVQAILSMYAQAQNLSVVAITNPLPANCAATTPDNITVQIRNLGTSTINTFDVSYSINNNLATTETISSPLAAGATTTYQFASTYNKVAGVNDIKVYTSLPGDIARTNDTARVRVVTKINTFPYFQNFETNDGGFYGGGTNSSWGWGSPNKTKMKPGEGTKSWYNGFPNGNYLSQDASYLTFPCFDFTTLKNPIISFKFFLEVELNWESVVLEYSTTSASSGFAALGSANEANNCNTQNWFNSGSTWSGNTDNRGGNWGAGCPNNICGKWVVSKHCIDFLKGQPNVYFRLRFASSGTTQEAEGVAIDSLFIGEPAPPPFNFTAANTCAGAPMSFTPTLHPCITSSKWNFGDNTPIITTNNAIHVYKNPGTYQAKLIVTSYCGKQDTLTKTVTVLPPPLVVRDTLLLKNKYCTSEGAVPLQGTWLPTGGSFLINGNPAASFNPNALGVGIHKVVYVYTEPSGNKCTVRDTQLVQVYVPLVSIDSLKGSYCLSSPIVSLHGTPAGGTFTVDGNPASAFNPATIGLGNHIVTYTYSDPNGCIGSASKTFDVVANIVAQISALNSLYCAYEPPLTLTASPVGGSFTIDGNPAVVLNPSLLDTGLHQIIYSFSDGGTCSDKDTAWVRVVKVKANIVNLDSVFCYNATPINLVGNPAGGSFWVDGNPVSSINPASLTVATHQVLYVYTHPVSLCVDSVFKTIRIDKPQPRFAGIYDSYCKNTPAVSLSALPAGGVFKLNNNLVSVIDPTLLDTGVYVLTYLYTNPVTNCQVSITKNIYIAPLPKPVFTNLDSVFCITSDLVQLHAQPTGGAFTINNLPVQMLDPSVLDVNTLHTIQYQYVEQNFGCVAAVSKTFRIVTPPSLFISGIKNSYCQNDSAFKPTGNPAGGKFIINDNDTVTTINPSALPSGTHKITYYFNAANGCEAAINQPITIKPPVTGNITPDSVAICPGNAVQLQFIGNGSIIWNNGVKNNTIQVTPTTSAYYWVKASECANFYDSAFVFVKPKPSAAFSLNPSEGVIPFSVVALANHTTPFALTWKVDTAAFQHINPLTLAINKPGQFTITLWVDSLGCIDSLSQLINAIEKVVPVTLPNVFTPNSDGVNDDFGINPEAQPFVKNCAFVIYNRWGTQLFSTNNPTTKWAGKQQDSDAPDGVYYFILTGELTDNSPFNLSGSVQIIRDK